MIFYFTSTNSRIANVAIRAGYLGFIATPKNPLRISGATWCLDNGCYASSPNTAHRPRPQDQRLGGRPGMAGCQPAEGLVVKPWDEAAFVKALERQPPNNCAFVAAPDVVHDADATLARALPWLPRIRAYGYPAALVAQDGCTPDQLPWDAFDVLFLGGSNDFKLGAAGRAVTRAAVRAGKPVHMGRVNTYKRMRYAEAIGCSSADGTQLAFRPSQTFPQVMGWWHTMRNQEALFDLTDVHSPDKEQP